MIKIQSLKNNTFNSILCNRMFLTIAVYQFFENDWIYLNHGPFFGHNILYESTVSNFENKL